MFQKFIDYHTTLFDKFRDFFCKNAKASKDISLSMSMDKKIEECKAFKKQLDEEKKILKESGVLN